MSPQGVQTCDCCFKFVCIVLTCLFLCVHMCLLHVPVYECFSCSLCVPSMYVCFGFFLFYFFVCVCVCVYVCPTPSQLQEAKQLERERHRQHSPVTQHTEPDSPQLQTPIHPPAKGLTQEANGPVSPPTPSIAIPSTPSTPSTPATEGSSRSVSGEQEEQREQEEPGEQGPVYESPDPENGSDFCVAENEQTEADQATAAAQSKTACILLARISYSTHWFAILNQPFTYYSVFSPSILFLQVETSIRSQILLNCVLKLIKA